MLVPARVEGEGDDRGHDLCRELGKLGHEYGRELRPVSLLVDRALEPHPGAPASDNPMIGSSNRPRAAPELSSAGGEMMPSTALTAAPATRPKDKITTR